MRPLVSLVTPTWQRRDWLMNRCVPSVQAQTYPRIEHVIVSDGPDPVIAAEVKEFAAALPPLSPEVVFEELAEHQVEQHWGNWCRRRAIELSRGEFIGYIDDDDRLFPRHCESLAKALIEEPGLMWVYSQMRSHSPAGDVIIGGPPANGAIGTPMIMHRRELLEVATWGQSAGDSSTEDWDLVNAWMESGAQYRHVPDITCEVWPSAYHR